MNKRQRKKAMKISGRFKSQNGKPDCFGDIVKMPKTITVIDKAKILYLNLNADGQSQLVYKVDESHSEERS